MHFLILVFVLNGHIANGDVFNVPTTAVCNSKAKEAEKLFKEDTTKPEGAQMFVYCADAKTGVIVPAPDQVATHQ